jgi:hypothetical protein
MLSYISCWPVRVVVLYPEERDITLKQFKVSLASQYLLPQLMEWLSSIIFRTYWLNMPIS